MKTKLCCLFITLALFASVHQIDAQLPVITSFSQNGQLVCANLQTGTVASVEWASSLSGPWNTNWAGLDAVTVNSNGTITVSVPMFYRVRGVAQTSPAPPNMVLIPAGTFTMGDTLDGLADAIPTNVTVSAFYMETNLVTYSQWYSVYNWATSQGYGFGYSGVAKGVDHPVTVVDWYDCVKWCNARSQQAGINPAYYTDAALTEVYTNGEIDPVYVNWTNGGYRLPTEAEWEKATRGGLSGQRFPWGQTISESQANYDGDTNDYSYDLGPNGFNSIWFIGGVPYTSPVGSFAPNNYGLYDMAGNVREWCWDWYDDNLSSVGSPYAGGADPHGPVSSPYNFRVNRGGSWYAGANLARCAFRFYCAPNNTYNDRGFRCVKSIPFLLLNPL